MSHRIKPFIVNNLILHIFFLSSFVLAIFSPTIHAEISLVDDIDTFNWLAKTVPSLSGIGQILFPGGAHGGYYRPLIGISFLADKLFLNANPVAMHFEGVLLHLFNAILVMLITRECLVLSGKLHNNVYPLFAGLLFGLHPITTESVNWISGRTDILMGNFVLLSAFMLVRYKSKRHVRFLILSIVAALLGALAKEAAFGYLAGAFFLYMSHDFFNNGEPKANIHHGRIHPIIEFLIFFGISLLVAIIFGNYWIVIFVAFLYWVLQMFHNITSSYPDVRDYLKPIAVVLVVISISIIVFFISRRLVFASDAGKIGHTIRLLFADMNYSISLFIGAVGFYTKIFFLPWPLNFFILEIDPLYDFVGITVVMFLLRLMVKNTLATGLWMVGVGLVLPALPLVFGTIAWTGYAERYIYLTSAFWIVALTIYVAQLSELKFGFQLFNVRRVVALLPLVLIIFFSITTWQRNVIWQKNVTLLKDTVDKSPGSRPLRNFYMAALFQEGRYREAKEQYEIGSTLFCLTYDPAPDIMMGMILKSENRYNDAHRLYEKAIIRSGFSSEQLLLAMINLLEDGLKGPFFNMSKAEIHQQIQLYRSKMKNLADKVAPISRLELKEETHDMGGA